MKTIRLKTAGKAAGILISLLISGITSVHAADLGIVNADDVNVRESASLGAKIIGKVTRNYIVEVLGNSDGWYKIDFNEKGSGWIYGQYLDVREGIGDGTVNAQRVNFREKPNTSSTILGSLDTGCQLTILEKSGDWYKAKTSGGAIGWIRSDFVNATILSVSNNTSVAQSSTPAAPIGTGIVSGDIVNLRKDPSLNGGVLGKLSQDTSVTVLSRSGDWYKVKTVSGTIGWIFNQFLTIRADSVSRGSTKTETAVKAETTAKSEETSAKSEETNKKDTTAIRNEIVQTAKKYLGVKYVYGGNSPKTGLDCSGFTKYIMGIYGIDLKRVAVDQSRQGKYVKKSDLRAGDLVFFDSDGGSYVNHTGIYIGDGNFIHASSAKGKVVISSLNTYKGYITGRSFLD